MIRFIIFGIMVFMYPAHANAQQERKHIRGGVKEYNKNEFGNAEVNFRKALDENEESWEASFNTGNALYKQDKPDDAVEMYNRLLQGETDNNRKADLLYNIGNTHLKKQEFQKSIDAYRNALRLRPEDEDARYNLAYAMNMLQEQENQQNQDENQDEDQDQDSEKDDDEQQKQDDSEGENEQQQQPKEMEGLSREEAERILQAIEDREKEVKEEVEKKRAKAIATPNEKDW